MLPMSNCGSKGRVSRFGVGVGDGVFEGKASGAFEVFEVQATKTKARKESRMIDLFRYIIFQDPSSPPTK